MSFAEKKVELFRIVVAADEELTGKLIEYANLIGQPQTPNESTISAYEKRSDEMLASGEGSLTKEESVHNLRKLLR